MNTECADNVFLGEILTSNNTVITILPLAWHKKKEGKTKAIRRQAFLNLGSTQILAMNDPYL